MTNDFGFIPSNSFIIKKELSKPFNIYICSVYMNHSFILYKIPVVTIGKW